jgi:septal ring factor EnvC (AmiA/AmiB activator)
MTNFLNPQENDKIRKEQAEHDIECNRVKDRLVLLEELFQELQTRNGELESHVQMLNEQLQQRDVKLQTVSNVNSNSGGDEPATLRDENLQLRGKNAQLKDDMVYLQHLVPENNRLKDQLAQLQQVQTINGALEHEMKLLHAQLRLVTEEKSKMKGRNS